MYYSNECLDCEYFDDKVCCNRPFFTCCDVEENYYDELDSYNDLADMDNERIN